MDSPAVNHLDIFDIYRRYCDIMSGTYAAGSVEDELQKARFSKEALNQLMKFVESSLHIRAAIFEEVYKLMLRLNLEADFSEFSRFYDFVFFICRENGQKNITISKAVTAWKLVLAGRFRLLDHWCNFVEKNQRYNISEDTWQQVLAFSRSVHENLEGYDRGGAWPVLIDDFVEHMYRIGGVDTISNSFCSCGESRAQPFEDSFPGLKAFPGLKRKSCGNSQRGEESYDGYPVMDVIVNSKRRHIKFANQSFQWTDNQSHGCLETVKPNYPLNHSASPCAVEGCLSKSLAGLFSSPSRLQFDEERRVSYT
ncbi:defective in cullin neddylation protein AAR3 [Nicotiana tabacum]|uniref:Defective in cullin neddylation protein n=1 Tax=Nicotiana tabacum TaxID=4097 RepID=A0A1S4BWI0_TOBAC|nr:DCN1-like protein 2 isoform X1 [Nicotiana tomentosiformis]XP_016493247.1 PREDICTED: DCN1-like protein 2 isoform X2 [Nicotiana tabacum]XP_033508134.1 DCN1-like protein 2 isoform X2 [Nicotiana tomentosiformis]